MPGVVSLTAPGRCPVCDEPFVQNHKSVDELWEDYVSHVKTKHHDYYSWDKRSQIIMTITIGIALVTFLTVSFSFGGENSAIVFSGIGAFATVVILAFVYRLAGIEGFRRRWRHCPEPDGT